MNRVRMTEASFRVPREYEELCRRRVRPLLNFHGVTTRSLEHLLVEAYIQGLRDAVDVN